MSLDFDKYAAKGNEMLNKLAEDLNVPRDKAARVLRAVLYGLRNRISLDESLQVVAQLPMALKAVYVDQWDPWHSFHRIHRLEQFIDEVRKYDKKAAGYDFGNDEAATRAIQAVFRTLNCYLSEGEFKNIIATLPHELKEFVNNSIARYKDDSANVCRE